MNATGRSTWHGTWKAGTGTISTTSETFENAPYTYQTRFEDENGVAPEELLAAAHASCYNQALANNLDHASLEATTIDTRVEIVYGIKGGRPTISGSHIFVTATVPEASAEKFQAAAEASAHGCTISRVLSCPITLTATLAS
jgi:osmotically inducible protein OsmC